MIEKIVGAVLDVIVETLNENLKELSNELKAGK